MCVFINPPGAFSLSVKDVTAQGEMIKHYKIRSLDEGGYYISPRISFPTLQDLVQYYSSKKWGVCWGQGLVPEQPLYFSVAKISRFCDSLVLSLRGAGRLSQGWTQGVDSC